MMALLIYIATHLIGLSYGLTMGERSMVFSQFAHETDWFSSDLFQRANNLCGMKNTAGHGVPTNGYESYEHWVYSITDYYNRNINFSVNYSSDALSFAKELKTSGYYTDSIRNYSKGIGAAYSEIPSYWSFILILCPMLFTGVTVWGALFLGKKYFDA